MSKEKRRVPKLRFPGFTEDWEQRKLGDFTNQINTFVNPEDAKLPLWSLTAEAGLIEKSDRYERDFLVKKKDQFKRIETNTLVYNPMNITIGSIDIYTGLYPIAVSGYYVSIVYDKNIDTDFLKEVLLLPSSLKMYKNYATGSLIERQRVQYPTFSKLQLLLPNLDEQKAIGQIFKSLNLNITLHQRKLEHLNLKKKALLQKLFPKNGECYPELRFPGFTDAWEQRKLSEIVTINPKTELPDEFKYVDLESVVGTNLLGFQVIKKENAPSRAQRLASYGDVFYQTVRPYQRNNYLFENVDKDMVFSTGYAQLRSKLDSYFLLTLVQNNNFVKVVLDNCTGTSYPAINGSELGKIIVQIPSNEVEANQIGKVFRGIDKSITLHQRKLDHLQLQKKEILYGRIKSTEYFQPIMGDCQ